MNVLEIKNLKKKFNNNEVIKDVSFTVEEGETLVILGPSGSGKSTILRCINNLEKIDGGNIIINNKKMIKEYKKNKAIYNDKNTLNKINLDIGMVFQDFNLFPHLTVKENIAESLRCVMKKNAEDADYIAYELLDKMGLIDKANSYPCDLSGGQKQRVGIARCLALEPKLICMDEPTSSLDPELVGEVLKVIKKLADENRTMVIVTHEIKFAEEVADRIIFMADGKIVEQGKPKDVIKNPKCDRTREFLKRYIEIEDKTNSIFDIKNEKPYEVLKYFEEISKIPRKSGEEKLIRDYLIQFALERNLECYTDKYYNVVIRKEASKGYEQKEMLAFQAHTDMICEKEEWSKQDFSKDPIELIKDGDFIKAKGTTLGADNGIGVAIMLALLDSKELNTPKIECIFTVQEETTMIGAKQIDVSQIKSKKIVSLDNGREDEMVISSANCMEWFGKIKKEYIQIDNLNSYELVYKNFKGGHSGRNIADRKRGNPIKLGTEILSKLNDIYINYIQGGSLVNAIPRDFIIRFSCKDNIEKYIEKEIRLQKEFYGSDVIIEFKKIKENNIVLSKKNSSDIIGFINSYITGAIDFDKSGNQILSANFGAVKDFNDYIRFDYSLRSNDLSLKNKYLNNLNKLIKKYSIEIIWEQELFGFEPNINSKLINTIKDIYNSKFNKEIKIIITQGVLEGGFFKNRINDIEYICIGPNTFDEHSPKERVSIKSINNIWILIKELLIAI